MTFACVTSRSLRFFLFFFSCSEEFSKTFLPRIDPSTDRIRRSVSSRTTGWEFHEGFPGNGRPFEGEGWMSELPLTSFTSVQPFISQTQSNCERREARKATAASRASGRRSSATPWEGAARQTKKRLDKRIKVLRTRCPSCPSDSRGLSRAQGAVCSPGSNWER